MASHASIVATPEEGAALLGWGHLLSDLDPNMYWPYAMGGLVGVVTKRGHVYNAAEAERLLQKGLATTGDARLAVYLAYLQLESLRNPDAAADTLRRGARLPRAPPFMARLATRILASRGHFAAARDFAAEVAADADPETRAAFEYRLREIDREELLAQITQAAASFSSMNGRPPRSIDELVAQGLLPGVPVDPLGGAWTIDSDGTVGVSSGERLRLRGRGLE